MYVRLRRGETSQNFNIWVYGGKQLDRGSGLFVPESGIAANHHFLPPSDGTEFQFLAGRYILDVFSALAGKRKSRLLYSIQLEVTPEQVTALRQPNQGLYFDWGPDAARYHAHIRPHPKSELP
jgi:hypothetical protein